MKVMIKTNETENKESLGNIFLKWNEIDKTLARFIK